jgi:hypothetical protein
MPFAQKFRKGMGFPKEGQVIKGFKVESVSISHINISDGRYEYPTEIVVKGEGKAKTVIKAFKEFYCDKRTLFSGYGNPYQCGHGKIEAQSLGGGKFMITSRGACVRVYLGPELERFMDYLLKKSYLANGIDEEKCKKAITEYIMEYQKTASRSKPFFERSYPPINRMPKHHE